MRFSIVSMVLAFMMLFGCAANDGGDETGEGGAGGGGAEEAGKGGFAASAGSTGQGDAGAGGGGGLNVAGSGVGGRQGGATGLGGASGSAGLSGGAGGTGGEAGGAGGSGGVAEAVYDPCPAKAQACKIMPLGDSITMIPGYRVALFRKSRAESRTITYVGQLENQSPSMVDGVVFPKGHEGYNGGQIDGLRDSTEKAITTFRPHIVLLMIGTNDAHRPNNRLNTAPERVGMLVDTIAKAEPNALIVVAKIVPTREDPNAQYYSAGQDARIRAFNEGLGPVLEQRRLSGKHVTVVDMYAAFTANANFKTEYLNENLHPSAAGYAVMTNVWWAAIERFLK